MTQVANMEEVTESRKPRMAVKIDLHNVEKGMERYNTGGLRLNYSSLIEELSEGYELVSVMTYDSTESDDRELKAFHQNLDANNFGLVLKTPQRIAETDGKFKLVQKEVDTSIVVDAVEGAVMDAYDVCLIVSGDRDMCPAVDAVKRFGKQVFVASFELPLAPCLKEKCDKAIIIENTMAMEAVPQEGTLLSNYANKSVVEGGEAVVYE